MPVMRLKDKALMFHAPQERHPVIISLGGFSKAAEVCFLKSESPVDRTGDSTLKLERSLSIGIAQPFCTAAV